MAKKWWVKLVLIVWAILLLIGMIYTLFHVHTHFSYQTLRGKWGSWVEFGGDNILYSIAWYSVAFFIMSCSSYIVYKKYKDIRPISIILVSWAISLLILYDHMDIYNNFEISHKLYTLSIKIWTASSIRYLLRFKNIRHKNLFLWIVCIFILLLWLYHQDIISNYWDIFRFIVQNKYLAMLVLPWLWLINIIMYNRSLNFFRNYTFFFVFLYLIYFFINIYWEKIVPNFIWENILPLLITIYFIASCIVLFFSHSHKKKIVIYIAWIFLLATSLSTTFSNRSRFMWFWVTIYLDLLILIIVLFSIKKKYGIYLCIVITTQIVASIIFSVFRPQLAQSISNPYNTNEVIYLDKNSYKSWWISSTRNSEKVLSENPDLANSVFVRRCHKSPGRFCIETLSNYLRDKNQSSAMATILSSFLWIFILYVLISSSYVKKR